MPSRQAAYQRRNLAAGRCRQCGQPREHYPYRCDACVLLDRAAQRRRRGHAEHREGGRGRPPKVPAADPPARHPTTAGPGAEGG